MNESAFFDDHPPAGSLPRWATITQVSGFLEIPRSAVSSTVRKAIANNEPWVKKEISEEVKLIYLIDTNHELYMSHVEQWKQRKARREDSLNASLARWSHLRESPFSPEPSEKVALSASPFVDIPWSEYEGFESRVRSLASPPTMAFCQRRADLQKCARRRGPDASLAMALGRP